MKSISKKLAIIVVSIFYCSGVFAVDAPKPSSKSQIPEDAHSIQVDFPEQKPEPLLAKKVKRQKPNRKEARR